jgi:hypothetical protein
MENYPTKSDGKGVKPARVVCSAGHFIRYAGQTGTGVYYQPKAGWDAGAVAAYEWNQMSRDERLKLLVLHWQYHDCNGFKNTAIDAKPSPGMLESISGGAGEYRRIPIRVDDLPTKRDIMDYILKNFNALIPEHFRDAIPNSSTNPLCGELPYWPYVLWHDSNIPTNILKGDSTMPGPVDSTQFGLYTVAVFNPANGDVLLEPKVVTAKSQDSAKNKAVGLLASNLPEGKNLDEVLDEVNVWVRPF